MICAMSDSKPPRKPFGERDDRERSRPFGSNPRPRRDEDSDRLSATTPYPERDRPTPPPPDPSATRPDAPYPWAESGDQELRPEPAAPDRDVQSPEKMSWDELIRDVSGAEPDSTPKMVGEDETFGSMVEETPVLSFGELEARAAQSSTRRDDPVTPSILERVPSFLKERRSKRPPIKARSYVEEAGPSRLLWGIILRTGGAMIATSFIVATVLTWWTPSTFLPLESQGQLALALSTQPGPISGTPTADPAITIGIVSGHLGLNPTSGLPDPGAVCADGLTEQSVNENIARQVVGVLQGQGYNVELLEEFDKRLAGYRALLVVSIHADSCDYINEEARGFKVASFIASQNPSSDQRLTACLTDRYAAATGMALHPGVTFDMTDYHNFREIDPGTPGAIIEVGFLNLDRDMLTNRPGDAARGIVDGILCFLHNELPAGGPSTPMPAPTETPTRIP
jgi:N-acetylmuramoyl-L-alanine amidase